ncbi:MAG TPA: hypothetical protein VMM83_03215 [Longimicrobiales bacterium]|nr:hypothetical protein [Longimicrobiales bacterium]
MDETGSGPPDLLLTRWDGVYHLVQGERRYGPYHSVEDSSRGLSNAIHYVLGKRSPMTFLHAGAIEIDGRAVIFPGRSRCGKSTLVASLVGQGCGYLSDEYAVVTPEGSILPLSKPIRLRREGGEAEYVAPSGVSAPGGLPGGMVVLTRYEPGVVWDPEPVTRGFAILGVLPMALLSRTAPDQVLKAITELVSGATSYRSGRGDSEPTMEDLLRLQGAADSKAAAGKAEDSQLAGMYGLTRGV